MQCPQCQHQNPEDARFCNACGAKLDATCPACGHVSPAGSRFCNACGHNLLAPASQTPQSDAQQATQGEPTPPPTRHTPDAERRQLTVMFCDLVNSTHLAGQMDPEDLRDVIRAYQATSAAVIERFGGYIAQHLGDGLLVYFGYPQAHEDDAQRAVRAGLGLLDAMGPLNTRLEQDDGIRLAVRIGIHAGAVVVGEIGGGDRHEQLALGDTPNIAARLQGMAQPDTVVISESTRRLVGGAFDVDDLGIHALKGVADPMQVYGVRGEGTAESRFEAATVTGLTLLVGREEELGLLLRRWEQAKDGEGQVILLGGEPGIGKSRITQTLVEHLAGEPHTIRKFWHPDNPGITMLSNWTELGRPKGIRDAGSYWHSDYSYRKRPANVTMLHALEIPDEGGDTLFADLCAAYQALNSEMQARLEGLTYRGQYRWHKDRNHPESMWQLLTPEERKHNPEVVHPVVRTHPETADKALFVFPSYGAGIKGIVDMDTSESDALIQLLFDHVTDPRFQYRFKWPGPGTLILWDNRCTMHAATTNVLPPDKFRTLLRISIVGDVPY